MAMSDREPRYSCPCIYCGRFVSWPYPRAGMEWHDICERMALRREFEREQLGYLYGWRTHSGGRR